AGFAVVFLPEEQPVDDGDQNAPFLAPGLEATQPVAAGGRYDGLLTGLSGGKVSATGIGGVVRPDRMVRVRRAGA
ncbi:MAG: hypothetical protein B7X53_18545, partial [Hyphomonas sp. 34-62-18]